MLPASDDRSETHVVITDPSDGEKRAIHFQEWWVRYRAQVETHSFAFVGADKATAGPGVVEAITEADAVLLAPSNPVVSLGPILSVVPLRYHPHLRAVLRCRRAAPEDRGGAAATVTTGFRPDFSVNASRLDVGRGAGWPTRSSSRS